MLLTLKADKIMVVQSDASAVSYTRGFVPQEWSEEHSRRTVAKKPASEQTWVK
jgi:hypothetical protein